MINENIYGLELLQSLLIGKPYLPFSRTSLKPIVISLLLNDIIVHQRKNILELGCGLSTILMARMIEQNGLETKITSVDHNLGWIDLMSGIISKENLQNKVNLIYSPLKTEKEWNNKKYYWYDEDILNKKLGINYDLILIDGPPAWNPEIEFSRIFAFPFLTKKLNDKTFSIMLDDIGRNGEKEAMNYWSSLIGIQSKILYNQVGILNKNSYFDVCPI